MKMQKLLESRGQRGGPGSNNTLFYLLIAGSQKVSFPIYKKKALSTSTFQVSLYRTQILKPDSWKNRPMRREAGIGQGHPACAHARPLHLVLRAESRGNFYSINYSP